jgi:hypothetical protein
MTDQAHRDASATRLAELPISGTPVVRPKPQRVQYIQEGYLMTAGVTQGGARGEDAHGRLKILYIQLATPTFAGIEIVVDAICTELAEKHGAEHEVDVLYTADQQGYPTEPRRYHAIRRFAEGTLSLLTIVRDVVRGDDTTSSSCRRSNLPSWCGSPVSDCGRRLRCISMAICNGNKATGRPSSCSS